MSVRQLKRKLITLQDEINLLQNSNEKVVDSYGEEKVVVTRRIEEMTKSVLTRFTGSVVCMRRAITKCYMREISKLKHFGEHPCPD